MSNEVNLLLALIVANWSALGAALKCADRIDKSRNIILGIDADPNRILNRRNEQFLQKDIVGYSLAMAWVLLSVGLIIYFSGGYIQESIKITFLSRLYHVVGAIMCGSSVLIGLYLTYDYFQIMKAKREQTRPD